MHRCTLKQLFIQVYCTCSLPESYDSRMIECEECQKWFHFKCMGLTSLGSVSNATRKQEP